LLLGIIVGTPCIGWLSDKLSKPFLLMIVGALFSSIFALIFYTDDQLSILQLSMLAFSLGFMTGSDGLVFSVISIEYRFMMSTATAIAAIFKDMVGMISQPLFGWIFEHSKSLLGIVTVANQMKAAFVIIPIACLFSVIIAFFSRSQKRVVHHTGAERHVHEI
jgi:MFS family permease